MGERESAASRIHRYFDEVIGGELQQSRQRVSFAAYALGLLGEGDRKSCEPIAARAAVGDDDDKEGRARDAGRRHDRLLHFLGVSPWDDAAVRLAAARYTIEVLEKVEPVTTWIVDDTGFPKQGTHSVGVQRQYSGTLGKIGSCQVGVSLSVATAGEQLPIDFALYVPKSWTEDPARRKEARLPEGLAFATKIELAVGMISAARRNKVPGDIVLADSAYGVCAWFRESIRCEGMDYGVATHCDTRVWLLDSRGRPKGEPTRVDRLATSLGRSAFKRMTWRDGTKGKLSSSFCFRRVKIEQADGQEPAQRESIWLVMEWPQGEAKPTAFFLTTLRRRMSKEKIVRILKERWRTEKAYEEMKGGLGLDHYEGRSYPGWNHHISVVISCYAFVIAERRRLFPPSRAAARAGPDRLAA